MIDRAIIQDFVDNVVRQFQPEKIILFGSQATGVAKPYSDVDLLVLMNFEGRGVEKAAEILTAIDPRFPIDLLVRRSADVQKRISMHDFFLMDIFREGKVMYESAR